MFCSYQEMYMGINDEKLLIDKRLEMVRFAFDNGYKVAARFYNCSKNTIKKWCRRYSLKGIKGLRDLSRKPKSSPKRIRQHDIDLITSSTKEARYKNKFITVNNIRRKTKINNYSDVTINRYINKSLGKIRNKQHRQESTDVGWKQHLLPFQLIQVDIKYLTDIDNLKPYFFGRNLMKYQITARDVATGFPIVAYCESQSVCYTKKFLEEILYPFLRQFKQLNLKDITIQTDNGSEFTNKYRKTKGKTPVDSAFTLFVLCKFKKHRTIIPGHCTAESDVESFHWSIERDCLAWDDIVDNDSLIKYTTQYIERYLDTRIKTRGYSPLEKIKTALDVTDITFPKPQLLTV
jgi:transposase-like protein